MERKSFLQHLAALGVFGFIPAQALKHYQQFYLLQCFVAGFKYYKGMELLAQMKQGDMLELVREPANKYDECAIALHWNKEKVGFVPASDNAMLSRLLDAGALELTAEITHLNKQVQPWENLCVAVYFLKEITGADIPENMQYLIQLETPHYTSYKSNRNTLARIDWGRALVENNTDWAEFFVKHSKNDSIYNIIMGSDLLPTYAYGKETGAYLLLNKKRIPNDDLLQELMRKLEETVGTVDNLFDEDGYFVVATHEVEALIPKLEKLVNVTDKLGRHFIEMRF